MKRPRRAITATLLTLSVVVIGTWWAVRHFSFEQRFARSRPELDAFAAQVMSTGTPTMGVVPKELGAFEVGDPMLLPHGFILRCDYGHPLDWNGLGYTTHPEEMTDPQSPLQPMGVRALGPNWYEVTRY